jgi:hypothetical protein
LFGEDKREMFVAIADIILVRLDMSPWSVARAATDSAWWHASTAVELA